MQPSKPKQLAIMVVVLAVFAFLGFIATKAAEPAQSSAEPTPAPSPDLHPPATPDTAAHERQTLTVAVVDQTQQPIQGARVCLLVAGREAPAQACTLTDARGFADGFELPSGERWRLSTSAEGYQPSTLPRPGELVPRGDRVRVTLRRGGVRLTGVVEDATGGTIEGALVSVEARSGLAMAVGRSGEAGEFELWASTGPVVAKATAGGYVTSQARLVLPSGPVRLVLLPESVIAGRVLDASSGQPIADAIVIGQRTDDDGRMTIDDATLRTRSGEDGRYELRGLPAGAFGLSSQGPCGFGASEGGVVVEFGSRLEDVDILVHRGTGLRIHVVIADTKQGCPGAAVSLLEENTGHQLTEIADFDGRVELSVPVAGSYRATVECVGHRVVGESPTVEVSGNPRDSEDLQITVERGLVARGVVVAEADGSPIAEAVVALLPAREHIPAAVAVADSAGHVELSGLEPGEYVVTATAPGWFPGDMTTTVALPSDASFELRLRVGGSLTGSILEPNDAPVPFARVLAHRRSVNGRWQGETLADRQGRYEFGQLPAGTYQIDLVSDGGHPLTTPGGGAASASVTVEGDAITKQDFVVATQDGMITGTVVDRDGGPITTAFVCAEPDPPARNAITRRRCSPRMTDIDGSFEIRGLSQAKFLLTARTRGGGEASLAGVTPGDDVELVVRATGSLQGSAHLRSDGSRPDMLIVEVVREDAAIRRREVFVRTTGKWAIQGLAPGHYHIRIKASRGAGAAEIEIGEGTTNAGDIALDDRTSLAGRVVRLETNEPIQGFRVVATALDAQLRSRYTREDGRNVSDADGRFLVSDPPSGRVTLHVIPENLDARPPDLTEAHITVTVNPGAPLDVGDVAIVTRRLGPDQPRASFGFKLDRWDHVGDQAEHIAEVIRVDPGGPAARAGLRVGDVITAIDGYEISGRRYILQYLLAAPLGTTITLDTERAPGLVIDP